MTTVPAMTTLEQAKVLIIGGSSGIGAAVAAALAERGSRLIVTGRDRDKLDRAAAKPGVLGTAAFDAHDEKALRDFFASLEPVDHVVSMIGDSMSGGFLDTTPETMRGVLHSKFWTNWMIGRQAHGRLRDGGSITFTAGTGGRAHEISASYVANLGLAALVAGLAVELAPRLRVNAVAPTFMGAGTSFWREVPIPALASAEADFSRTVPLGRVATVPEVASTYLHLIENTFITGQVIAVDGGVMLRK